MVDTCLSARRVAGLLDAPGCARRIALELSPTPDELADQLGCPPGRQSPYAHARARMFTARCTADNAAALVELARETIPVTRADTATLAGDLADRAAATRARLAGADPDTLTVLHDAVLELPIAGGVRPIACELLAFTGSPRRLVEIRTFARVDGLADPAQLAAAARQVAVLTLAVEQTTAVDTQALLVLPENFSLVPCGSLLDVAPQVRRLRRLLAGLTAAPAESDTAGIRALPSRFGDGCLGCALFGFCRAERAGSAERLGTDAANLCGSAGVADALALAHRTRTPSGPGEEAVAAGLSRAARAMELIG